MTRVKLLKVKVTKSLGIHPHLYNYTTMSDLTGRLLVKAFKSPTVWKLGTAAYRAYKKRKLIGGALATAGYMARGIKRRKISRKFKPRKRVRRRSGSGNVIGQYAQRSGRTFRRRGRRGRRVRSVKQQLFRMLPVHSFMVTNMPGGSDVGYGHIRFLAKAKQTWSHIGMYGCGGTPNSDGVFTTNQDQDLWSIYTQYAYESQNSGLINSAKNVNSSQFYIMNSHVSIDILYNDGTEFNNHPAEVTFYVVQPRKSQRLTDKLDATQNPTFLQKFRDYFDQDRQLHTTTGTSAYNAINPLTTYGATPFDSNTFCKEWVIKSQKNIIVENGHTASFTWGRSRPHKIKGADLDEYDFMKGVYTAILVRIKPLGDSPEATTNSAFHLKYTKKYNYKVIDPSQSSAVVGVQQDASFLTS